LNIENCLLNIIHPERTAITLVKAINSLVLFLHLTNCNQTSAGYLPSILKYFAMKRIITLSSIVLFIAVIFAGCTKQGVFDERYWLSKERGEVVYSSYSCSYYLVQTYNGYTVVGTSGGYRPSEGTIVYGDFSSYGVRNIYDRTDGIIITGNVKDYWLTYNGAQDALDYYCY
jgi:hypothetical protein